MGSLKIPFGWLMVPFVLITIAFISRPDFTAEMFVATLVVYALFCFCTIALTLSAQMPDSVRRPPQFLQHWWSWSRTSSKPREAKKQPAVASDDAETQPVTPPSTTVH
ncbi:MAG: hypothetical protein AAB388_02380 [Patescibacteria group bacterium]